jgi:pyruvate/2-oxoglutarate dehydrogenase complex dihydrolipoamide dehydrogenase (E3) component
MKKTDVLIIGGSAAGMVTALTGKSNWADKDFILVKKQKDVMVPCGIPYIFGTLNNSEKNLMPVDAAMEKCGVTSVVDEAVEIKTDDKTVKFASGEVVSYNKLVIATGSIPIRPKWCVGADLENVFVIPKERQYLDMMSEKLDGMKNIIVIGAGFIGVELSDELNKRGMNVSLVEKLPHILNLAFDPEIGQKIEELVVSRGVKVIKANGIKRIIGETKVEAIELENGEKMTADAVVLSMGYKPNTDLAKTAGIPTDENNFIIVDEYMLSDIADVFAVGDCAQKRDFVTRKKVTTMLASTACAEARVAGMNLFNLNVVKTFSGTIAVYSTALDDYGYGTAGITEQVATREGIEIVTGMFEGVNRHPGNLPGAHKQIVKLIAAKHSGIIIGGEVVGGPEAGELTNVIGLAIQNRMSVNSLLTMQIGTHPCLTASPAAYPLIKAAELVAKKLG